MPKKAWATVCALLVFFLLVGCSGGAPSPAPEKSRGTLKVVFDAEPPTLDMQMTTSVVAMTIAWHMFEGLFSLDAAGKPIPMLAERYDATPDGLTYTFKLREGVKFHDGKELTSEDVLASLQRWGRVSGAGKKLFADVEAVSAPGKYEVQLKLKQPNGLVLPYLAMPNEGAVIYPKAVVEEAGDKPIKQFVGTGPFKFVEWLPNQSIKLARFKEYKPVDVPASGYGGKKEALVDELIFYPMTSPSVRSSSVESGEYHWADFINVDEYDRLKSVAGLVAKPSDPRGWFAVVFNQKKGVMSKKEVRQAFLLALDMDPIMAAGYGNRDFWRLDPSIMFKEQAWWTDAGAQGKYDAGDKEQARRLLKAAGYKGEPVVWMSGPLEYNFSLAAKQQLEEVGFKVDLQAVEWATLTERRKNPDLWNAYSTGFTIRADPTQMAFLSPTFPGWWENPQVQELINQLQREGEFGKRYELWKQVQQLFYEDVPVVKIGDYSNLRIWRDTVQGFSNAPYVYFWNVSLAQK